jgi:hypothetical protein
MSDKLQYACDEHGWDGFTPCPKCQPKNLVLRRLEKEPRPRWAVVKLEVNGGRDIDWFRIKKLAKDYMRLKGTHNP